MAEQDARSRPREPEPSDDVTRGRMLEQLLDLAEQYPWNKSGPLTFPVLAEAIHRARSRSDRTAVPPSSHISPGAETAS